MSGWRPWSPGEPLVANRGRSSLSAPSFPGVEASERLAKLARSNDAEGMTALLNSGVSPDVVLWGTNTSLLAHCLGNKRFAAAQALLDAGADPCFPLTHYDEFMLEPSVSGAMSGRLKDVQTALGRAAQNRQWDKVVDLLARVHTSPRQDPTVRELVEKDVSMVGVSMVNRKAPVAALGEWFGTMERLGVAVSHKDLLGAQTSQANPSRPAFDLVLADYQKKQTAVSSLSVTSQDWDPAPVLTELITSELKELVVFEFNSTERVLGAPKGMALGWLIQAWQEQALAVPGSQEKMLSQLKDWTVDAVRLGYARLLDKTLLPLFPPSGSSTARHVWDTLIVSALKSNHHTKAVLGVLEKHCGKAGLKEVFRRVDAGVGEAWRHWLSRPVLPEGPNARIMAQALVAAGVKAPQRSDRSFLEEVFSTGNNVLTRFKGAEGARLVRVLMESGADPSQPNLMNEVPAEVLARVPDPKGELDGVKAALNAELLDRTLNAPATASTRSPRF